MNLKQIPDFSDVEKGLSRLSGMRDLVRGEVSRLEKDIVHWEEEVRILELVSELFRTLIDREIEQAVLTLKRLQSKGLAVVFDDQEVSLDASVSVKRGKVSVDLATCQGGTSGDVLDSYGGSIATLQSILLRLIVLRRRGLRPCLFLDESISAVSSEYARNMSRFFKLLCKKLNLDMLVITLDSELTEHADRVYRVKKGENGAYFEEEK